MRIRVRQLCGGGLSNNMPYWAETIWCGVTLARCYYWLLHLGWGTFTAHRWSEFHHACMPYADFAPLRLRLKGRCWIEAIDQPATLVQDGVRFNSPRPPHPIARPVFVNVTRRRAKRSAEVKL